LQILGDGPQRAHLARLAAEMGIVEQVTFLGRVPSTEAAEYYRRLDLLVLPSLTQPNWVEQFGRVLIEAMACGIPVIGSDSGEIPWVIGDAGVLFPEGDAEALADVLRALMADETRRGELAARGRARVLKQFTQSHIAEATAQVYASVMRGGAGRA
jgi:glycosyltransferase involved in cell wall biosynthesis